MLTDTYQGYTIHLVETDEELDQLRKQAENYKLFSLDSEDSGLDYYQDKVVGVSIGFGKPFKGYYLPVRHVMGNNLTLSKVLEFVQFVISNKKTIWFNRNYDFNMLEKEGIKIPYLGDYHDAQILCWLTTNEGFPSLKKYTKDYLHFQVMEYEQAIKKATKKNRHGEEVSTEEVEINHDFGSTDCRLSWKYAACDAVITMCLFRHMWNNFPYIRKIYPLDNQVTECIRRAEKTDVPIDFNYLRQLQYQAEIRLRDLRKQIIDYVGYEFNVNCYSDDTEFLTESGYKRYDDITDKDKIAQYNPDNGQVEFSLFLKRYEAYSSRMINFYTEEGIIKVTENHKMYASFDGEDFILIEAKRLLGSKFFIKTQEGLLFLVRESSYDFNITRVVCFESRSGILVVKSGDFGILCGNSSSAKAEALGRFCTLTVKTKSGKFSTKDEYLEELHHPLADMMIAYSKQVKYISSFITPMLKMEGRPVHFSFKTTSVPSGRFAAGKVRGNSYYCPMNVMALPKIKEDKYVVPDDTELGFHISDSNEGSVAVQEVKAGYRNIFKAPDDCYVVTSDYCGEEVCIIASASQETTWLDAINAGKDVHMASALKVFGIADKHKRQLVKTCTFLINYGGGPPTLANRLKIALSEATDIFNRFHKAMVNVSRWIEYTIKQARKTGMMFSYYGRPRVLYKLYQGDASSRAFADRSAVNFVCQGDITGSMMVHTNIGLIPLRKITGLIKEDSSEYFENLRVWNGQKYCDFGLYRQEPNIPFVIETSDGSIFECGTSHVFKVVTEEGIIDKHINDLQEGDKLLTSYPTQFEYGMSPMSDFQAYLLGRWLGDGATRYGDIAIACSLQEIEPLRRMLNSNGVEFYVEVQLHQRDKELMSHYSLLGYRPYIATNKKGSSAVMRLSRRSSEFIHSLLINTNCTARTKRIPDIIFRSSLTQRANFIKGFYDSDGSKTNPQFEWHMCQKPILNDLQILLWTCGIRSNVQEIKSDGTFKLTVSDSTKFANFIGVEDKDKTMQVYGRVHDEVSVPKFEYMKLLRWINAFRYSTIRYNEKEDPKRFNRDKAHLTKLRKGKNVGMTTYYSVAHDLGYDSKNKFYYTTVRSIKRKDKEENTWCICLNDESHQYEANMIISHNCVPLNTMVEARGSAVKLAARLGHQIITADGRQAVVSSRGQSPVSLVLFNKGHFIMASDNHGLIYNNLKVPKVRRIQDGLFESYLTSKKQKRKFPSIKVLFYHIIGSYKSYNVKSALEVLPAKDAFYPTSVSSANFLIAALRKLKLRFKSFNEAASMASIASVAGYDLRYHFIGDKTKTTELEQISNYYFTVHFTRPKKVKAKHLIRLEKQESVGSLSLFEGLQFYQAQGFQNKNTGADLMRWLYVKYFNLKHRDKEFDENVTLAFNVHDEVVVYVKKSYLFKFYYIHRDLMWIRNRNWGCILKSDIEIGTTWGNGVKAIGVLPSGKLVIEGVNDELLSEAEAAAKSYGFKTLVDFNMEVFGRPEPIIKNPENIKDL